MSEAEWAWAGGLFEGEGWINVTPPQPKRLRKSVRLGLKTTDEDVLLRFAEIVAAGSVSGPTPGKGANAKPLWTWTCGNDENIRRILQEFAPWLGQRRQQRAYEALEALALRPPSMSPRDGGKLVGAPIP